MCASSAWAPSPRPAWSASSNRCAWWPDRSASRCTPSATAKLPHTERTDRDIPIIAILLGVVVGAIAVAIFFGQLHVTWTVLALGLALTLLFSFFFTSVAANAIATTANNPASGMTMLTVIISAVVLLNFGLSGTTGMFFVMAIAGMVCTALCVSGQFITDLKAGYWIGSTPGGAGESQVHRRRRRGHHRRA